MSNRLEEAIQTELRESPDLLKPEYREREDRHPLEGHCYVAAEAYFHAVGGYDSEYTVHRISHEGETHWFLRDGEGTVVDPTATQFETPVPYDESTKTGFLTRTPSKRAQQVLDALNEREVPEV